MRFSFKALLAFFATFLALLLLHLPLLRLPYYWDEAGYYIPAALDFYRAGSMIPTSTPPVGHTPLMAIYLGLAWRLCGYSSLVTRSAILLLATAEVMTLYAVGKRLARREVGVWSAILLTLSPLFFAQSTLVHLDLAAALFTTLAVLLLHTEQFWLFALAASLAVVSKETAVVLLPVAWVYGWRLGPDSKSKRAALFKWMALAAPLGPLAAWAIYYHHVTGFWTGNREYLSYNLYSTLSPARFFWTLLRHIYELFIGGFNWLLTASAILGLWWWRKRSGLGPVSAPGKPSWRSFLGLVGGLTGVYLILLSAVGGAVLPRYLLPVIPLLYLVMVAMVMRLPRLPAHLLCAAVAACFVWAWFINPPYPYPYEDNLAYADFVRLHQDAAKYLESQTGAGRILTAWPASDELGRVSLGYVRTSLQVVRLRGFAAKDFADVSPESFDLLYLYSQKWEPAGNWASRFPPWLQAPGRHFDYRPQVPEQDLAAHFHLKLLVQFERRGQWVKIYSH